MVDESETLNGMREINRKLGECSSTSLLSPVQSWALIWKGKKISNISLLLSPSLNSVRSLFTTKPPFGLMGKSSLVRLTAAYMELSLLYAL